jgi:phosphomethylpyrimidine synthase
MTQLESAKKKIISVSMKKVAKSEGVGQAYLCKKISEGKIVILKNKKHKIDNVCAIGEGLRTKVNVNLGTSSDKSEVSDELKKLKISIECGADTVMDLSVGGDLKSIRKRILNESSIPVGTVPIYEVAVDIQRRKSTFLKMTKDDILKVIEEQAKEGVDFFTIHAGVTQESMRILKTNGRLLNIVSRGGAILARWMIQNKKENPLYEYFDDILDIARQYDVTLSLGDSLRPGSILDASDKLQMTELALLGELAKRSREKGVQVIIEGPGHVPLNEIRSNVVLEKKLCHNAPFYVLGPLVTDIASGYDHISAAIGGAIAASAGADFLCFVTPSEHLRHPTVEDVKEGLIALRIAAHAADITKGIKGSIQWDEQMSIARKDGNWQAQISLSIDPEKARRLRLSSKPHELDVCTMCSEYCSVKLMRDCMGKMRA